MKKKFKSKIIASLLTVCLVAGNASGFSLPALANYDDGNYTEFATDTLINEFDFGADVTEETVYSKEFGYGFENVEYSIPASGWDNGIYYPRVPVKTEGANYVQTVTGPAISTNMLELSSKVWTETESSGYGVYTYESTSTFNMDLQNADYDVKVTFENPTDAPYTAYIEAEDITKASGITVTPGASVTTTIAAVLVDGQLNLKFLKTSSATAEDSAAMGKVYISKVSIVRQATNQALDKPTIFLASDSTVQTYETYYYPQTGWGQVLHNFFGEFIGEYEAKDCTYSQARIYETKNAIIENRAIGGRSSKSFIEEGKLDDLLEDVKPGDFVMVQWGHNDATSSRPNRYVSPSEFPQHIKYYIDGVQQRGGTCILVTPVARYSPNGDGTFGSNFEAYRQAMITLGISENVPVLDLTEASIALCEAFGIEGAKSLFLHLAAGDYEGAYAGGVTDSTHLQYYGAYKFAQCVAKLIRDYPGNQLDSLKTLVEINIPTTAPAPVTNPKVISVGATSVNFIWDRAEGAELYYIYRAELTGDQNVEEIDFSTVEKYSVSSGTKFTDKNCEGGKTYVYAIRGFNEFGLGELSDQIQVTTKSAMYKYDFSQMASDPVMEGWNGVHSTQLFSQELGYGWISAPGNGRYRANNGNPDSSAMADDFCLGNGEFAVNLPNGDYEIKIYAGDLLPSTSTIKASYTAEGLSLGTISAKQAIGTLSAVVRVTDGQLNVTVGGTNPYINGMEITPLLLAPSSLSYSEFEFNATNVTFLINFDKVEGAVSYNIYQKATTDVSFGIVKTIAAEDIDNLNARAMAAKVGETRQYYVTAVMPDGSESAPSPYISIEMTDPNIEPPVKPVGLTCVSANRANIIIKWEEADRAIYYNIYRSTKPEGDKSYTGYKKIGETMEPSFTDTDSDLTTNIHYYYKVEGVGIGGIGEKSDTLMTPITEALVRDKAETLKDRALVAVDLSGSKGGEINVTTKDETGKELTQGVYLSWRLFESDPENVTFDIYRNDVKIASNLTVTNCVDPEGGANATYKVVGSSDSSIGLSSVTVKTWENYYIELQLDKPKEQTMPDGSICTYTANDMSVGDLDNDGVYELIVKWAPSNAKDNSGAGYTGTTILDAYDFDLATGAATLMWRIDLGVNIRSGAHYTQFQVWDFDGDGSAEVICKTADGSTTFENSSGELIETGYVGATNASNLPTDILSTTNDYRNSSGYVLAGPEYLTIFDGETGRILDTAEYLPERGSVDAWGDGYGNRVDRFLSAVAYLDGETPSAIFTRGYYTRSCLTAYDFVDTNGDGIGDKLSVRWKFDTNNYPKEIYGETEAQGNHALSVNDVDKDGKDEIIYGAMVIDHNGELKYTTELGHGDAQHTSDWIPSRPGLEIFSVHEHSDAQYQVEVRDAETGEVIWGYFTGKDTGRGVAADVDPTYEGSEMWANVAWDGIDGGLYSSLSSLDNFVKIADTTPDVNFSLFWDGDLLSELQNHTFNNGAYIPVSTNITKWNYLDKVSEKLFESSEVYTSNGTKGNLGLVADILGDWREEIIARSATDDSKIRIYTSTIETDYTIPCLMENDAYRIGVAWQNVGYNQPANLDYLLSEGIKTSTLTIGAITKDSVELSFTPASDGIYGFDVEGYEVYRRNGIGEIIRIGEAGKDTYSYTDETIDPDKDYSYYVAAVVKGKTSYLSLPLEVKTLLRIKEVVDFELDDLAEGTQIPEGGTVSDLLPSIVKVIDSNDKETTASVTWDVSELNILVAGTYTVKASVSGYDNLMEKTVKVVENKITTYEFAEHTKTSETEPYYTISTVKNAASLDLPTKATFKFLNGTSEEVNVTWNTTSVDMTKIGSYSATGTTSALSTSGGKFGVVTIKVNIEVKEDYIVSLEDITAVEVDAGSSETELKEALPTAISAVYKSGKRNAVDVTWHTTEVIDLLDEKGSFEVNGTVTNYPGNAKIQVYVNYNAIWKFDFGISTAKVASGWTGITVSAKGGQKTVSSLGIDYTATRGYGFTNSAAIIEGRDEGYTYSGILTPKVYNDFVLPDGQTFLADVPNGIYNIEFTSGSSGKSSVKVTVEGASSVFTVSNAANTYNVGTLENIVIKNGQISMYFAPGNISRLNAVVIRQVSREAEPTPTGNPTPTVDPTPTGNPTPTVDPSPTGNPTPTVDPTPTGNPTLPVDPTPTGNPTPTVDPSPTGNSTPSVSPVPTRIPTQAPEPTITPAPEKEPVIDGIDNVKSWGSIVKYLEDITDNVKDKKISIKLGEDTVVPKESIEAIKGKDVTVVLEYEGYTWSINGKNITGKNLEDIDLSIIRNVKDIPESVIDDKADKNTYVTLQLAHEGEFGFYASLTIDLNKKNAGKIANLYYYNPISKILELQSVHRVDKAGLAELSFHHASDYVIVLGDNVLLEDETHEVKTSLTATTLYVGGTIGNRAEININMPAALEEAVDKNLIKKKVTYTSSNKKVATISTAGKITAKGKGKTTITTTVTIGDTEVTFKNVITVKTAYIKVVKKADTMKLGESFTFAVEAYGYKETDVTYSTSQKSIVAIGYKTGKASAVSKGTDYVVIRCKNITKKIKVTVK